MNNTLYFPSNRVSLRKINGIASLIEPHSRLEVGLTTSAAAAHAACTVTSILREFNYRTSSGATWPAPHRLAPQQAINEYKEVLDGGWVYYVIGDGSGPADRC